MKLSDCHNVADFRRLAKRRLPYPVFHYIDGAADDEGTKARNTAAFDDVDLVPNVLAGSEEIDMGITLMGRRIAMPLFLSPTALQRLFHWEGERAVARAERTADDVAGRRDSWAALDGVDQALGREEGDAVARRALLVCEGDCASFAVVAPAGCGVGGWAEGDSRLPC